jgi:hypothetical protein
MKTPNLSPNKIKDVPTPVINKIMEKRESVFARFPLLFTLLGTFGVVATFYGFERVIDRINFFSNHPFILLLIGLLTLLVTGTLYKRLG